MQVCVGCNETIDKPSDGASSKLGLCPSCISRLQGEWRPAAAAAAIAAANERDRKTAAAEARTEARKEMVLQIGLWFTFITIVSVMIALIANFTPYVVTKVAPSTETVEGILLSIAPHWYILYALIIVCTISLYFALKILLIRIEENINSTLIHVGDVISHNQLLTIEKLESIKKNTDKIYD